uniref:Reverse transcriptase domain-containing protein n=1 Tax=Triticum urartu TaxID=4572 RepID=A0A8R7K474_TRIUA
MMERLGFCQEWIGLIMKCVSTVRYQIKVNGSLTEHFVPTRGLRQGDPLSPYLFVICAEALSALLQDAERRGRLGDVWVCQGAPAITHLFFADDSVLMIKATREEATELKGILDLYEDCSGQCINKEKSAIMFSANTPAEHKESVKRCVGISSETWNEHYLGLLVYVG